MIYGYDISHYQGAFNHAQARSEGFSFAAVKATEGTGVVDSQFASNLSRARKEHGNKRVIAYHFQRPGDAAAQVTHIKRVVPRDCAVAIDVESGSGNFSTAKYISTSLKAAGYRVGVYTGQSYWRSQGSPSLTWADFLWSARYPSMSAGYASSLLARTPVSYWDGYGGFSKAHILQFTSTGKVAGQQIDCDAFNGSIAELEELFYGKPAASAKEEELDVSAVQEIKDYIHHYIVEANIEGTIDGKKKKWSLRQLAVYNRIAIDRIEKKLAELEKELGK